MTEQLRALVLAEDLSLVSRTHVRWLITACEPIPKGSATLFWPPQAPALLCTHIWTHTPKCKHNFKK